jgi:hypothetical protein
MEFILYNLGDGAIELNVDTVLSTLLKIFSEEYKDFQKDFRKIIATKKPPPRDGAFIFDIIIRKLLRNLEKWSSTMTVVELSKFLEGFCKEFNPATNKKKELSAWIFNNWIPHPEEEKDKFLSFLRDIIFLYDEPEDGDLAKCVELLNKWHTCDDKLLGFQVRFGGCWWAFQSPYFSKIGVLRDEYRQPIESLKDPFVFKK